MSDEKIVCFVCKKSDEHIIIFSEETLKKCQTILKLRKIHNLKYRDIILPSEYTESGYHRVCYKVFTGLMKKYFTSQPLSAEKKKGKKQGSCVITSNSSSTLSSIRDLSSELPDPQSPSTESSSQLISLSQSTETQPSTSENESHLQSVSTESPTTSQPAPICESIDLQSATLQDISDVFEPEVSDNNFVSQDVNISTDNIAGKNDNEVVCIFCNKKKKKVRSRMLPLHAADVQQFKDSVKPNIESHKEFTDFSNKLDNFSGSKIYYHTECRVDFNNKLSSLKATPSKKEWHYHREYHQTVFNEISTIIKEDVIKKGRCFLLVYLHESYIDLLEKIFQENSIQMTATFTAHHLEEKILKVFSKDIKFFTVRNKKILAPKYLEAIDDSVLDNLQQENILRKSALILRKIILQIEKIKLPTKNITSQHLISGEVSIPEELSDFYSTLLGGCNQKRKTGQKCSRLVRSYCQDVIFGVHDGRVKTSKHIMLDTTDEPEMSEVSSENTSPNKKRRRRTFDEINIDEMPYPKKPKMTSELQLSVDDIECIDSQINTEIDNIWMISHALELPDVPMWVGFNSRIDDQDSPQQHISYLTPINASPTSTSIVLETMKQSQKIAEDLQQPYIQVTYDLAIAKVALQIQATENPTFDNLFIHLGPFHIMMAYFKAIGKVISDCGLTTVMVESSLLANGSVNGFLDGKHFNRCKRLHPLVALGLEILHFKSFLQNDNITLTEDIIDEVKRLQNCKISLFEIENDGLKELMNNYGIYKQQTLNGEHGKTSQFYLIYINLIHHYLDLSRSIRTGNFQLFKSVLPKITSIFFVLNQQNYARWSVKYYDSLLRVDKTHPDLYEGFLKGCFGIKRTTKPFSRQPIDLVLEQTINAEAARRLTGVIHFTNSISARQRWARNHDVRSTIISQVYLELGLQKHQDISTDLNPHNIRKNAKQLQQFVATFDQFINPFSLEVPKDQLVNISSGKSASLPVEEFLLNLEANGDSLRRTFISECQSDITRFEKAIKKTSINNFSKDYEKKKIKVGGKIQEVKIQRDLFGRMLGISMDYSIDISKILSYPITSVPLSMCHLDGTICKTDKSALMKCLEKEVEHEEPSQIDILIIDGFFLLHTMKNVPRKFGGISKKMLQMVTQLKASRIDVIFDQYFTPSIKGYERSMRFESAQLEYTIAGPEQVRPSDFVKELKNSNFKEALVDFFILHWASDEMAPFIGNKIIHINFRKCHSFTVNEANKVMSSINEELSCPEHEEADNKIVYHACKINYEANIVIRTVDTDVAAIMLSHMHRLNDGSHVWMLTGAGNNLRYVDLTKIHAKLGESICRSLPGLHAFTGCDYNPAFYRKAKLKPYKLLKKYVEFQLAFMKFGDSKIIENNNEQVLIFDIIQSFICYLYNMNDINDVDAARLQMFINSYTVSDVNEAFNRKKLQNFDASCLPPCKSELLQQFLRANYICSIWNNAHLQKPTAYKPVNNGWILENDHYYFKWFEGDQLPNYVSESLKTVPENNEEGDIEDDQSTEWNNSDEEYGCIDDDDENDENV
ncbi:uncharacterized protein LOC124293671 isoform X3 [Neodiprion lecontei]|uniref:Uncharacterized protein LOC124293671 isoform X3 n=1 Tax=Neodiprion lecontei TaxID=441921 RepID=A0ABM3FU23_NEOLC|nr:uncharacterized protein LOC124293671 isoform X3 [Neodiprion lecontei]